MITHTPVSNKIRRPPDTEIVRSVSTADPSAVNGKPPTTAREAAPRYHARGWNPLPLPPLSKKAVFEDWSNFRFDLSILDEQFPAGEKQNIGILLGARSNGLVEVDHDSPESRAAAPFLLPPTDMISGRESAPDSHWWYITDQPPEKASEKFLDPTNPDKKRNNLLELRSTGGQTVVPPSVYPIDLEKGHPKPERCIWSKNGEPASIDTADLQVAVKTLAAAALLARHWPKGARNEAALALAGGLRRADWLILLAENFIRAVCAAAHDEEPENRVATVEATARRLNTDKNAVGWPALAKILGQHGNAIVSQVREWLNIRSVPVQVGKPAAVRPPAPPIPPYTPFPTHLLPPVPRAYVEATAAAMNCDSVFSALPVLAALGAAIGSSHMASPKRGWKEPPYIWALPIGRSGAVKSPPYRDVEDMAEDINDRLETEHEVAKLEYETTVEQWTIACKAAKNGGPDPGPRPTVPVKKSFIKGDVTIEALVGTLHDNPRGLFIGQDELSAWINGFVKYSGKTGASDLPRWLQLSNAGSINYTRKTGDRREVRIRGVGVSVAGTIQPKTLARVLNEEFRASGFLARLLLAMPPWRKRLWTEAEVDEGTRKAFADLLSTLFALPHTTYPDTTRPAPHLVKLSDEAKRMFIAFYNENGAALETADEDMSAVMSKLEGYALRFALIFHCCRLKEYAKDTRIIGPDMEAAIKLTMWFRDETERVYMALGETPDMQAARQLYEIVRKLAERYGGRLTTRQLQQFDCKKYPNAPSAEAALESLVGAGLGTWVEIPPGPKGGRPTRAFVPSGGYDKTNTTSTPPDDGEWYSLTPDILQWQPSVAKLYHHPTMRGRKTGRIPGVV